MIEKNILKKKINNIIKMSDYNKMRFKDFNGYSNFNVQIDPFLKNTRKEVETMIHNSKDSNKNYFEWLDYKTRIKPYYDIDMFYEDQEEQKENIEKIKEEVLEILKKYFPETDIAISSSHGEKIKTKTIKKVKTNIKGYAVSYHFVLSDYETTVEELREFNEKNKFYDFKFSGTNEKIFDKSVYRDGGNMRFLYSYKPNDKRQKIPDNYKDSFNIAKHIIQSTDDTNYWKRSIPTKSPPSSPPVSPKKEIEEIEDQEIQKIVDEESDDDLPEFEPIKTYDVAELMEQMKYLTHEDCYEYDTWIKIGMAIHNITGGDNIGRDLFITFSRKDEENFDKDFIHKNWGYWDKAKNNGKNKVGMTFLKKTAEKYKPQPKNVSCEYIFRKHVEERFEKCMADGMDEDEDLNYGRFFKGGEKKVLEYLNKKIYFVKETGEYIILDTKEVRKENGEKIMKDCWYLKNQTKAKDHFRKENFSLKFGDEKDGEKFNMNPFDKWCEWDQRREVRAIGFDPSQKPCKDIFNLWTGFNISREDADQYNEEEAEPILEIIRRIWCQEDEESYNYILDLFAHFIQKPHIKTGVLLALKSKQGGSKGLILNKLAQIIGESHYVQNSNADNLFGNFNGQLEGKIVCNLDEAFWGGDKKLEGMVKNKITEKSQSINKKNKELYQIDDYVNYIITTNNDWFSGVTADDRRHYCIELSNELCGRMTEEKMKIVQPVLDAPAEAFAKVLYNRNIEDFNPRVFKKTRLLQDQVERNLNSVRTWYHTTMKDGGFDHPRYGFTEWGELWKDNEGYSNKFKGGIHMKKKGSGEKETAFLKEFLFDCYNSTASDNRKFGFEAFFKELKNNCLKDIFNEKRIQLKKQRRVFLILPSLEDARKKWNELQEFDYIYDDVSDEYEIDEDNYGFDDDSEDED